ncbi:uncharacterized protein CXorf38 homolog [Limanda limanda]|uniref:uncharacterized protein CXorf38 homolog n=1 Tax=Limanda limanda TaxID=27771 RepID=UPI0029C8C792|nr:uncharacterized protein CXorf38 homolog [Limanda limanda]
MVNADLRRRLNDKEYKNWLKASQCLFILTKGLHLYTSQQMEGFHKDLLAHSSQLGRTCETNACRGNQLSSACGPCSEWKKEIMAHQRQPQGSLCWVNCSPPSWRTDFWEVAKAYMPRGQRKVKGADQCDASALLRLIYSCDRFESVNQKYVTEVIHYRNEIMHSSVGRIMDEWMSGYQTTLKHFVQQFSNVPQMGKVGQEIDEALTVDWKITASDLEKLDIAGGRVCGFSHQLEANIKFFSQWEAELLQEKLQELLHTDDEDAETQVTKQLEWLGDFLQANSDLDEMFSEKIQAIHSLREKRARSPEAAGQ